MSKLLPALADHMAAMDTQRQQRDEAPRRAESTLYVSGEGGQVDGQGSTARCWGEGPHSAHLKF